MKCLKEQSKDTEKYKKARKYCTERLTRARCNERRRLQLASLNFTKTTLSTVPKNVDQGSG